MPNLRRKITLPQSSGGRTQLFTKLLGGADGSASLFARAYEENLPEEQLRDRQNVGSCELYYRLASVAWENNTDEC